MDVVLGFDFGGTKVAIAVARNDDASTLQTAFLDSRAFEGYGLVEAAVSRGQELLAEVKSKAAAELVAVGVSTMGITYEDRVEMAPNVPGWETLRMPGMFREGFPGVPVAIDNDVKAAGLAEVKKGALSGVDVGMYLNLGTGVAIALTLGDKVISGSHGAAGEVAYCLTEEGEVPGFADGVTPLEEHVGGIWIERRAEARFHRPLTPRDIFVENPEPGIAGFRDETLSKLAFAVINAVILWNPGKVVVGGGMANAKDVIFPYLRQKFARYVPFPPELAQAQFGSDAGIVGALELARMAVHST